jgi:hypothetical protein
MIDVPARQPQHERPRSEQDALAFELWLRADLARRFGQTTREPLPDELLSLLPED